MMMTTTRFSRFLVALSLSGALAACSGEGGTTSGSMTGGTTTTGNGGQGGGTSSGGSEPMMTITVNGKLVANAGNTVPATGDLLIAWSVSGPQTAPHLYAYGSGQSMGTSFQISLGQAPPTDALTVGAVALGIITLFPTGKKVADGVVDRQTFKEELIGATDQYAIFYKVPNYNGPLPPVKWIDDFPPGYSCAKRVPAKPKEMVDSFAPVDCSQVTITVDTYDNLSIFDFI